MKREKKYQSSMAKLIQNFADFINNSLFEGPTALNKAKAYIKKIDQQYKQIQERKKLLEQNNLKLEQKIKEHQLRNEEKQTQILELKNDWNQKQKIWEEKEQKLIQTLQEQTQKQKEVQIENQIVIKNRQGQIQKLKQEIKDDKKVLINLQKQKNRMNSQIRQLTNINIKLSEDSEQKIRKLNDKQKMMIKRFNEEKEKLKSINKKLQYQLVRQKQRAEQIKQQFTRDQQQLKQKISQYQQQEPLNKYLISTFYETAAKLQTAHKQIAQRIRNQQQLKLTLRQLQSSISSLKNDKVRLEKQKTTIHTFLKAKIKYQQQNYRNMKEQLQMQIFQLKNDFKNTVLNFQKMNNQFYQISISALKSQSESLSDMLFSNTIFINDSFKQQKKFVLNTISKVKNTHLIYIWNAKGEFQSQLPKIDKALNYCLIVQTIHQHIVVAVINQPKKQGQNNSQLLSLTNQLQYPLKVMNYSQNIIRQMDHFLIIGNNDLIVKYRDNTFKSQFGQPNSMFQGNKIDRQKLLGMDSDQVEIQSYELYQVTYIE